MPGGPSQNYLSQIPHLVRDSLEQRGYLVKEREGMNIYDLDKKRLGTLFFTDEGSSLAWKLEVAEGIEREELADAVALALNENGQHLRKVLQ